MKSFMTTTIVASAVLIAGWAYAQEREGMAENMLMMQMDEGVSDQMMDRCRMTMGAELSSGDPAVLLGMKEELQLSDEQVDQLQTLAQETRQAATAILTDAQRQEVEELPDQPQSMMQMHQQMMECMDGGMEQMQGMGGMDMCAMMMRMMGGMHKGGGEGEMKCPMCGMEIGQGEVALAPQPAEQVELDAEAQAQVDRLVSSYLTIQESLAQDEMQGIAAQFAEVRQSAESLNNAQLEAKAEAVAETAQAEPGDLEEARDAFKDLSAALIELTQVAAPNDQAASALYVANCPMAGADWLQASEQIVNPYMGQRMVRCGSVTQTVKEPSSDERD